MIPDFTAPIWMGFQGQDAAAVPTATVPGGVVLFARNLDPEPVAGPARCHALLQALHQRWGQETPLAVAIDQEGGPVSRLRLWVGETPSFRRIWITSGAAGAEAWGHLWGEGLRRLGININFAPLVDLHDGIPGTGLGDRRASGDPHEAGVAAATFLKGLEAEGVQGCLKHFPGLGGTRVDSHHALPELSDPATVLRALAPFRSLARPERLIMVAHVRTPWSGHLPASLDRGHVAGNPWGIPGAWVTDDLEMGGCGDWPWPERIRLALEAGHLALLVCQSQQALDSTVAALQALPEDLLRTAVTAGQHFRRTLPPVAPGPFDPAGWADWVDRVKAAAGSIPA